MYFHIIDKYFIIWTDIYMVTFLGDIFLSPRKIYIGQVLNK